MRILLTGADGRLGRVLRPALARHDVVPAGRDVDVADEAAVSAVVHGVAPDLVVHAAAWTDVDGCERDPDRAHRVNALGAWWVARACDRVGAAMLLLSTDHVFSGDGDRPWTEFDPPAPVNEYGRSKAAAEALVRETLREHYIVRTAWLLGSGGRDLGGGGPHLGGGGPDFVTRVLQRAGEEGQVEVVGDQVGSPTFAPDLAAALAELVLTRRHGTYHRTNAGAASRFELARAALELAGSPVEARPMTSDRLDQPAARPRYAVLSNRHAELSGLTPLRHWREALAEMLGQGR